MKILLVDDHVLFREGIALLLRSLVAGDSLYQAGTCDEALALVAQDPTIELVLMDINLSGMNGPECVRRLKPLLPKSQFMMLTVYEDSDHIIQALQSGATGYLLKHTQRAELINASFDPHSR